MKTRLVLALLTLATLTLPAADNTSFVSIPLDQAGGKALDSYAEGTPWASVPSGERTYGGVPFTVLTKLQLHGNQDAKDGRFYHERVMGLPVGHSLTRLHLLHGANISEKTPRPIASVRVNYTGGSNYTFFITYGAHVRYWWRDKGSKDDVSDPNSSVVWSGRSDEADQKEATHRLYKSSFDLPSGMPVVESLDLFSLFGTSSEVILAITGEFSPDAKAKNLVSDDDSQYRESITVKIANRKGNPILGAHVRGSAAPAAPPTRAGVGGGRLGGVGGVSTTLGRMDDASAEMGVVTVDFPTGARSLYLTAQAANFVPETISLMRGTNGVLPREVSLRLAPGVEIGGVVRDPDGKPLAKAKVEMIRVWPTFAMLKTDDITTDAQGRWKTHEAPETVRDLRFTVTHANFHRTINEMFGDKGDGGLTHDALLAGEAQFQMERKINFAGTVRAGAGRPLSDVNVSFAHTHAGGTSTSSTRADRKGAFRFTDVDHGPGFLVVQDAAFAPIVVPVDPGQDTAPVKLVLSAGTPLRGQFVEQISTNSPETRPVGGLSVTFTAGENDLIRQTRTADAAGRFEWLNAPAGPVRIAVSKPGQNQRIFNVRAGTGAAELKLDLSPTLSRHGVVLDEETKQAVTNFTATSGHRYEGNGGTYNWVPQLAARGQNGVFSIKDQDYCNVLKVEAPGYQPRAFPFPDRGEPGTNVYLLHRGGGVKGAVKLADGSPAVGAQLALIGDLFVSVGPGKFSSWGQRNGLGRGVPETTDAEGRFELPPSLSERVVVMHPAGYLETTLSNLAAHAEVKLQPFGTVEGLLLEGRAPVPDSPVQLRADLGYVELQYNEVFTTTTDAQGRFHFTNVPPGTRWVSRLVETQPQNKVASHSTPVEVVPGAVVRVNIGGTGRPVVAQLVVPEGITIDWKRSSFSIQKTSRPPRFRTTEEQRVWQLSPEGRESQGGGRTYIMLASADGRLRAEDVPPGPHRLRMQLHTAPARGASPNSYGQYIYVPERELEIEPLPEGHSDEPLDLGPVEVPARR